MANFDQFLDSLTDEELQLMDSDPDFFKEMKTQYDSKNKKTGLDKAVEISEKVQGAVAWPFQKAAEHIPGVAPVLGAVGKVAETVQKPFDIAGEKTAEFGGKIGVPPEISAGVGTGVAMIPDIVASIAGGGPAKKGAQLGAKAVRAGAKTVTKPISSFAKLVKSPGLEESKLLAEEMATQAKRGIQAESKVSQLAEKRLRPLKERVQEVKKRQTELPIETVEKETELFKLKKGAGERLGQAEKEAGLEFKSSPKFEKFIKSPEKVSRLTERLQKQYADLTPEQIAAKIPAGKAQTYRKILQETDVPTSNIQKAQRNSIREQMAKRVEMVSDDIKVNRSAYQEAIDAIDELPLDQKKKAASIKNMLNKADNEVKLETNRLQELKKMAKKADADELANIDQQRMDIIKKGMERDKKIGRLKKAAVAAGLTATGVGSLGWIFK